MSKPISELPEVKAVEELKFESPDDVLVFSVEGYVTPERRAKIYEFAMRVWPNRNLIILDSTTKLKIVRKGSIPEFD